MALWLQCRVRRHVAHRLACQRRASILHVQRWYRHHRQQGIALAILVYADKRGDAPPQSPTLESRSSVTHHALFPVPSCTHVFRYGGLVGHAAREIQRMARGFLARKRTIRVRRRMTRAMAWLGDYSVSATIGREFVKSGASHWHASAVSHHSILAYHCVSPGAFSLAHCDNAGGLGAAWSPC